MSISHVNSVNIGIWGVNTCDWKEHHSNEVGCDISQEDQRPDEGKFLPSETIGDIDDIDRYKYDQHYTHIKGYQKLLEREGQIQKTAF